MAINTVIRSQKFFNQYKNGIGFTDNLTDYTNNFTGAVGEKVKAVTVIEVEWNDFISSSNVWTLDLINLSITRSSGSWTNEGFSLGDICAWFEGGIGTANITIDSISQDGLTLYYTVNSGALTDPSDASLFGLSYLTALVFKFGLLGNSESFNFQSKVTQNDMGFYAAGIGADLGGGVRDGSFVPMQRLGSYKGWQTGTMQARFIATGTSAQRFEIEHEFIITPYYLDGEISNLENNIIPTLYNGANTLKYAYNASFRTVLSNPNTEKSVTIDDNLGSIAWFNENFNGFQNDYSIQSINYSDWTSGDVADGLLISGATKVEIEVFNTAGILFGARIGAFVSYLPEQNEYQNTTLTDLQENFIYDYAVNNGGLLPAFGGDFISNFEIVLVSAQVSKVTFKVEYSAAQKIRLSSLFGNQTLNFLIGLQIGDVSISSGNSDRVMLLADVNEYDQSPDISGLLNLKSLKLQTHNTPFPLSGYTDLTAWNEDGFLVSFNFDLDLNKNAFLNTLEFKLIAFNTVTEQFFELDSFAYNVANSIIVGGVQQLNETTTRGYILENGDQFNDVTISTGALNTGKQTYTGFFAQKFSWQSWIENLNADTVFYDSNKDKNNLNFKTSNYSGLNDYEIRISMFANVEGTSVNYSGATDYLINSPQLNVFDYEKDGNIPEIWSCEIETFNNANNANLGGSVLSGQDTLFRATWTHSGGAITSLTDIYGINRIEETGQLGYAITEMSSLREPAANQILIPNSGTKLLMYINAGLVVMECLIDGSQVNSGSNFNLSSRIHSDNVVVFGGKITEQGIFKDTEDSQQKIIE